MRVIGNVNLGDPISWQTGACQSALPGMDPRRVAGPSLETMNLNDFFVIYLCIKRTHDFFGTMNFKVWPHLASPCCQQCYARAEQQMAENLHPELNRILLPDRKRPWWWCMTPPWLGWGIIQSYWWDRNASQQTEMKMMSSHADYKHGWLHYFFHSINVG